MPYPKLADMLSDSKATNEGPISRKTAVGSDAAYWGKRSRVSPFRSSNELLRTHQSVSGDMSEAQGFRLKLLHRAGLRWMVSLVMLSCVYSLRVLAAWEVYELQQGNPPRCSAQAQAKLL